MPDETPTRWSPPAPDLELPRDAVYVWRTATEVPDRRVAALHGVLAPGERARARRFRFERDRRRFTVARGVLRRLLGRYLRVEPAAVEFRYGVHGKPSLPEGADGPGVRFNLSHSRGLALHAFALGREVGVDVERLRPDTDVARAARRFLSPAEADALMGLAPGRRREAFFECWTRKEAFVKARGEGVVLGLRRFDVSLRPGEPAALLRFEGDPAEPARWSLCALDPGEGYKAALAVEGGGWELRCWDYPEDGWI